MIACYKDNLEFSETASFHSNLPTITFYDRFGDSILVQDNQSHFYKTVLDNFQNKEQSSVPATAAEPLLGYDLTLLNSCASHNDCVVPAYAK
jgi:hypothetical protein